jgi:hypothetical protein
MNLALMIGVIVLPFFGLICFGLYLVWLVSQHDDSSVFEMDEDQNIAHDKNREGIVERMPTFRELNAQAKYLREHKNG